MEGIQWDRIFESKETLCDAPDDRSSHHPTTSTELARGLADHSDAGVLRSFGGEVGAEGYLMAYMPRRVYIATTARGQLSRTTLPADRHEGRAGFLPRPFGHDTAEHFLDSLQGLGLTDLLLDDPRLEGLEDLITATDLGDEVGAHVATTVGDRIEEG